jgi:iron complex transport system ATP-binding protein
VTPLIVKELVVRLGGRAVVDGIDLRVEPGQWVAVVGPNGAGKSTLLHAISGIVRPDAGRIELNGRDARRMRVRERARLVALVPQIPVVPVGATVLDYVLLGRTPHLPFLGTETSADVARAEQTLELLDVHDFAGRRIDTLSGGERQRMLLARALLQDASVLLLDEPTTALDIGHQQDVLELVDSLRRERGLSIVSALHDLTLAGFYADELVLLHRGRVVARGSADEVITPEHLERHFGARVTIIDGRDGPVVVASRSRRSHDG